ncbi:MAG: hypothetical protein RMJ83_01765 [Armatimonadota bacterium]|nr:hypothetical protein [Armatimonadota bacterium]
MRGATRFWWLGWLAAATLVRCGEPTYSIRRSLQTGERWRYTLTLRTTVREHADALQISYTDTVRSVAPDGSAIAERTLQADAETLRQLQAFVAPLGTLKRTTHWKLFPDGRETPLEPAGFFIGAFTYAYPDRPVRKGAQWGRLDGFGSLSVKYLCRFEGIEAVEGVPCYKIHAQVESMPDSLPQMHGEMTVYVDQARGWTRHIKGTLSMQAGTLRGKFELDLRGAPLQVSP